MIRNRWNQIRAFMPAVCLVGLVATIAESQSPLGIPRSAPTAFGEAEMPTSGTLAPPPASVVPGHSSLQVGASGEYVGFSHADGSGNQTITVLHAGKSWMAVYHVDRTGKIWLRSSRPIAADFSLQLNATSPLPDEIREMQRQTRSPARP